MNRAVSRTVRGVEVIDYDENVVFLPNARLGKDEKIPKPAPDEAWRERRRVTKAAATLLLSLKLACSVSMVGLAREALGDDYDITTTDALSHCACPHACPGCPAMGDDGA